MKKTIIILSATVIFFACSKKDTDNNLSKIMHKWQIDSIKILSFVNDTLINAESDTIVGVFGDYFEFRSDGKLYQYIAENAVFGEDGKDTVTYTYSNNKILLNEGGHISNFTISELSDNKFTFEAKGVDPADSKNYKQAIVKLKK